MTDKNEVKRYDFKVYKGFLSRLLKPEGKYVTYEEWERQRRLYRCRTEESVDFQRRFYDLQKRLDSVVALCEKGEAVGIMRSLENTYKANVFKQVKDWLTTTPQDELDKMVNECNE